MSEEPNFDKILSKATRYCSRRELCKQDMKKKLFKWKAPEYMHQEIIDYLLDENEYELICRNEIRKKLLALKNEEDETKKRTKIFQNLLSKGFESELIQKLLREEEQNRGKKY